MGTDWQAVLRCANSLDEEQDCGFILWEDALAAAEEDMRRRWTDSADRSLRRRTADIAGVEGDRSAERQRRAGMPTPTPRPSQLNLFHGLQQQRDAEAEDGDDTFRTVMDILMDILKERDIEIPGEAMPRIQDELFGPEACYKATDAEAAAFGGEDCVPTWVGTFPFNAVSGRETPRRMGLNSLLFVALDWTVMMQEICGMHY